MRPAAGTAIPGSRFRSAGRISCSTGMHDWMYFAEPEASMDGRPIECARGKVIGGSSSINAMAYVRGHRADYDRWAEAGLTEWSYASVLPYFRRQESWEGGDEPLSRRRWAAYDAVHQVSRSTGRGLFRGGPSRRPSRHVRLQRRAAGGARPLADDRARRPSLQRGGRLSAARAQPRQPDRRH